MSDGENTLACVGLSWIWKKTPDVAYGDFLKEFDNVRCIEVLLLLIAI